MGLYLMCFRSIVRLTGYDSDKQEINRPSELLTNVKVKIQKKLSYVTNCDAGVFQRTTQNFHIPVWCLPQEVVHVWLSIPVRDAYILVEMTTIIVIEGSKALVALN